MPELLGRIAGDTLQAELPPLRLLPKLFGLLLISRGRGGRKPHLKIQVFGPIQARVAETGFYRFPVLGAAEAQRCQAAHAMLACFVFPYEAFAD
ncbi:MAG TPA: hypothetical protein VJP04_01275 [Terriglobales bacterium]|nr:hypothetical protein [Terriglobales bacterium]